jgi:uncharacterized membrane protein YeaQ/YmgE (transglycosylase-associated protein family)
MQSSKFLITITRILAYFSLFYAIIKGIAIFKGQWFWPNFILGFIGVLVAYFLFSIIKKEAYNWYYVVVSVVLFSFIRFYEQQLIMYLNNLFS